MKLQYVFLDDAGTLRCGWRCLIFLIAYALLLAFVGGVAQAVFGVLDIDVVANSRTSFAVTGAISLIPAIVVGWLCCKFLEKLPISSLGVLPSRRSANHLALGLIAGLATFSLAAFIAFVFGGERFEFNLHPEGEAVLRSLAASLVVFAIAAAFEEALFRGYILQTLDRSGLAWLAVLLTSVFFGLVHLGNPNANLISTVNTILAGLWFSFAYFRTRDLWFVWGMHLMWNWTQGSVFGIEVSGVTSITPSPLLREIDNGPTWLTGTTYGIEGGLACTVVLAASIATMFFAMRRQSS